jgi:hypothetical protein
MRHVLEHIRRHGDEAETLQNAAEALEEAARRGDYTDELGALKAHLRTYSYLL